MANKKILGHEHEKLLGAAHKLIGNVFSDICNSRQSEIGNETRTYCQCDAFIAYTKYKHTILKNTDN